MHRDPVVQLAAGCTALEKQKKTIEHPIHACPAFEMPCGFTEFPAGRDWYRYRGFEESGKLEIDD